MNRTSHNNCKSIRGLLIFSLNYNSAFNFYLITSFRNLYYLGAFIRSVLLIPHLFRILFYKLVHFEIMNIDLNHLLIIKSFCLLSKYYNRFNQIYLNLFKPNIPLGFETIKKPVLSIKN